MLTSKIIGSIFFIISFVSSFAQKDSIQLLQSGNNTSLRGLSVVDDKTIWVSGSNGTVARSLDGGKNFEWIIVPGYEKRDFRDVEAFDANIAIIMAIAEPAVILKTKDGGKKWYKVFEDSTKGMFLDAMDFVNEKYGMVIGDPINNKIFAAATEDSGEHWEKIYKHPGEYETKEGEAFFAASGTNIILPWDTVGHIATPIMVSGGKHSGIFINGMPTPLPLIQGAETTGANSVAISNDGLSIVVAGGDFSKDKNSEDNFIRISFNSEHPDIKFIKAQTPPHGYRSCVAYITNTKLICCGTSGVDISYDGGNNWQFISSQGFHACAKAKKGSAVFLAGSNGRIATLLP